MCVCVFVKEFEKSVCNMISNECVACGILIN